MHNLEFAVFFSTFAWLMLTVRSRRRVVAVTVAGVLVAALVVSPPPVQAQGDVVAALQAVLSAINGVIQTGLNGINTVRTAVSSLYQNVIWPVQWINQAKAQVLQMMNQFHSLMTGIVNMDLRSASLPNPQSLETVIRDHQVNNFASLTEAFANTYGAIPTSADASQSDRDMSDLDDALALDTLKTLKVSDSAADLDLKTANSIESAASQAAPGSAPFLTAAAAAANIRSQALTQKMLAAELRQEAAHIAHQNGVRKRGAAFTTELRGAVINLLQHN